MRLIPIHERQDDRSRPPLSPTPADRPAVESQHVASELAAGHGHGKRRAGAVSKPRGIARVPTHTVGRARERRHYVRASLALPLSVRSVAGRADAGLPVLSTQDISSSGVFFLCPRRIEPGTPIEMEVTLVDKPLGRGTVRMRAQACVVRVENAPAPGWHGVAAAFDDITFVRDEPFPAV